MEENQTLIPPVSEDIQPTEPVSSVEKPLGSPKPSAKAAKSKLPILIIGIILFLLIIGGVVAYNAFKSQVEKDVVKPTLKDINHVLTPAPTTDPTLNWKTFIEKGGRFNFKYPPDFKLIESRGESNNVNYITLKSTKEEFKFSSGPKEKISFYSNFATGGTEIINGITWIVTMSQQYCDPANCSSTAPGYYVVKRDFYVGVNQNDKINDTSSLKSILSTFRFD